jgi:feruloyl esterase
MRDDAGTAARRAGEDFCHGDGNSMRGAFWNGLGGGRWAWIAAVLATTSLMQSTPAAATPEAERCATLRHADFSLVLDAPTQILDARLVAAKGDLPAFCQVDGYVIPQVGFRLQLPRDKWNGKFIQIGCGGYCGRDLDRYDRDDREKFTPVMSCTPALRKGYACIRTDNGHRGDITEAKWAYHNLQAQIDHGFRATHVTTLAGKAITGSYYGKTAGKSYFMGCSGGGVQALTEAQRFPWDYDGIIAGAAPIRGLAEQSLAADVWTSIVSSDGNGKPILSMKDIALLHRKVVGKCDLNDGVKDGLIGDPRRCKFDPSELACSGSNTGGCLSQQKIEVVQKIYRGPTAPPGVAGFAGQVLGSELGWGRAVVNGAGFADQGLEGLRYLLFDTAPGPQWTAKDFDLARDYQRFGISHAIMAADNPDLRKFKRTGAKLLMYVGWADRGRAPVNVDYYETVERVMGGKANTQDFFRLFAIPGMGHCFGGEGPDKVDYLSALEAWVEQGKAPDVLIAEKLKPQPKGDYAYLLTGFPDKPEDIAFTRPIYPYPLETQYKGSGDPDKAENFEPAAPE